MNETCETCQFFHDPTHSIKPTCRRYPPTLWVSPHNHKDPLFSAFPNTPPKAWCGEWKRRKAQPVMANPMRNAPDAAVRALVHGRAQKLLEEVE